jgi:hypothetical protein
LKLIFAALVALLLTLTPSWAQRSPQAACINQEQIVNRMAADGWEVLDYKGTAAVPLITWYNNLPPPSTIVADQVLLMRHDDFPYLLALLSQGCLVHVDSVPRNALRWPTRNT